MSQDFPYLEDWVTDRSTLFPHKDIHLVGAMGAFYGTLIGFHPDLAAELVRRYQALDERHSVLFVGVDDDEESMAARRLLERGGKFEVIVRPVGSHDPQPQIDRLIAALNKIAFLPDGRETLGQYEIGFEDGLKSAATIAREALRGTEGVA